jgi:hypothetical protein
LADFSPGGFEVTRLSLSDEVFELGEDLFDGIEVGAVGRQEDEVSAFGSDDGASGLAFVAAEVVQDDDIARREDRGENLLDVKEEGFAVDRPIDHPRRINPVVAQRGDEGQGLPMAMGRIGLQPSSPRPLAPQGRHVGLHPGLVDEHKLRGRDPALMGLPPRPLSRHVRTRLFLSQQRFF